MEDLKKGIYIGIGLGLGTVLYSMISNVAAARSEEIAAEGSTPPGDGSYSSNTSGGFTQGRGRMG
jgi:hypothetical protein